jgi:hypothetical protein
MRPFEIWQLQFDQLYDGAYRYLDRCGEFMASARQKFGFMPTNVNLSGCDMELPDFGITLRASTDALIVVCSQISHEAKFVEICTFVAAKAVELFDPFSVHHSRFVSRGSVYQDAGFIV